MSMDAILEATASQIRTELNITIDDCDVRPEGRPPAVMGDFYVGVDEASVRAGDKALLHELLAIEITLTLRTGQVPNDRLADIYRDTRKQLGELERKVIKAVDARREVTAAADKILDIFGPVDGSLVPTGANGDRFQLPLYYMGRGRSLPKTGEWAGSTDDNATFYIRTLNFGGALREQNRSISK